MAIGVQEIVPLTAQQIVQTDLSKKYAQWKAIRLKLSRIFLGLRWKDTYCKLLTNDPISAARIQSSEVSR